MFYDSVAPQFICSIFLTSSGIGSGFHYLIPGMYSTAPVRIESLRSTPTIEVEAYATEMYSTLHTYLYVFYYNPVDLGKAAISISQAIDLIIRSL